MTAESASDTLVELRRHLTAVRKLTHRLDKAEWNDADCAFSLRDGLLFNANASLDYLHQLRALLPTEN